MKEKTYAITLSDGSVISGLRLNGNNYISDTELNDTQFAGKLSPVVISDGSTTETYTNMELVQLREYENEYWFILRELSDKEVADRQLRADIDYISMMSDIQL